MANNSEMSLDEVLSSIKQMVIEGEPPVLELTEMIDEKGKIVTITNESNITENKTPDMSSFLKLVHKNSENLCNNHLDDTSPHEISSQNHPNDSSKDALHEMIKSMLQPALKNWIDKNIQQISKEILTAEIQKISSEMMIEWMQTNLPTIVAKQVETEIASLLRKYNS